MKLWLLFLLSCCIVYLQAQSYDKITKETQIALSENGTSNFWVFFTNKGNLSATETLQLRKQLLENLPENVIQRRKNMPANSQVKEHQLELLIEETDFPVSEMYIERISSFQNVIKIRERSKWLNAVSIAIDDVSVIQEIAKYSFVSKIKPVRQFFRQSLPMATDEEFQSEYIHSNAKSQQAQNTYHYGNSTDQLTMINVPALHNAGYTGEGINILITDSGFNLHHPCFSELKLMDQYDFINDDDNVQDETSDQVIPFDPEHHGTATLSVLAGLDDGNHYGVAFHSNYYLAKTENSNSEKPVEEDYFIAAVEWGEAKGVDVISTSLGYQDWYTYDEKDGSTLSDGVINTAVNNKGIVVVVSAGNDGIQGVAIPGDALRSLTVGAVSRNLQIASFSSRGPTFDGRYKPDVCALGVSVSVANNLYSSHPNEQYVRLNGTSFSCPLVAGTAALLIQMHKDWRPIDVHNALITTADQSTLPDIYYGFGIIDAKAASQYSPPTQPPRDHGTCDDFSVCNCHNRYYGPYCSIKKMDCDKFCTGGYCDNNECKCDSVWINMICAGACETITTGCYDCLDNEVCGWCPATNSCITSSYASTCPNGYSESFCVSFVAANNEEGIEGYYVMAVIMLCFALLLVISAVAVFFCIVRP